MHIIHNSDDKRFHKSVHIWSIKHSVETVVEFGVKGFGRLPLFQQSLALFALLSKYLFIKV